MSDISLTIDQKKAFENICDWYNSSQRKPYFKLGGLAGTGKTTLLNYAKEKLKLNDAKFAAYTGKAASIMRRKGIANASTIHSMIYHPVMVDNKIVKFEKKPIQEVQCSLIVVDEASMVDSTILRDLLSYEIPIIFCGDYGQLPPVKNDLPVNLMDEDSLDAKLETICRQDEDSNIIRLSRRVRDGYKIPYCNFEDFVKLDYRDFDIDTLCDFDQIICGFNVTKDYLNYNYRKLFVLDRDEDSFLPKVGEKIIITDNNSRFGVFNGQQVYVQDIKEDPKNEYKENILRSQFISFCNDYEKELYEKKKIVVEEAKKKASENKNDNSYIPLNDLINEYQRSAEFFEFPFTKEGSVQDLNVHQRKDAVISDFAYVITCHKSQGSEWDNVLVIDEWFKKESRIQWLYTALTRASKKLTLVSHFYKDEE